jgi:hypothetical protein
MDNAVTSVRLSAERQKDPMVTSLLPIFQEFLEERPTTETLAGSINYVDYAPWKATRMIWDWYRRLLQNGQKYVQGGVISDLLFCTLWEIVFAISREIPYNSDKKYVDYHSWEKNESKNMGRNDHKREILAIILEGFEALNLCEGAIKEFRGFTHMDYVAQKIFKGKWRGI